MNKITNTKTHRENTNNQKQNMNFINFLVMLSMSLSFVFTTQTTKAQQTKQEIKQNTTKKTTNTTKTTNSRESGTNSLNNINQSIENAILQKNKSELEHSLNLLQTYHPKAFEKRMFGLLSQKYGYLLLYDSIQVLHDRERFQQANTLPLSTRELIVQQNIQKKLSDSSAVLSRWGRTDQKVAKFEAYKIELEQRANKDPNSDIWENIDNKKKYEQFEKRMQQKFGAANNTQSELLNSYIQLEKQKNIILEEIRKDLNIHLESVEKSEKWYIITYTKTTLSKDNLQITQTLQKRIESSSDLFFWPIIDKLKQEWLYSNIQNEKWIEAWHGGSSNQNDNTLEKPMILGMEFDRDELIEQIGKVNLSNTIKQQKNTEMDSSVIQALQELAELWLIKDDLKTSLEKERSSEAQNWDAIWDTNKKTTRELKQNRLSIDDIEKWDNNTAKTTAKTTSKKEDKEQEKSNKKKTLWFNKNAFVASSSDSWIHRPTLDKIKENKCIYWTIKPAHWFWPSLYVSRQVLSLWDETKELATNVIFDNTSKKSLGQISIKVWSDWAIWTAYDPETKTYALPNSDSFVDQETWEKLKVEVKYDNQREMFFAEGAEWKLVSYELFKATITAEKYKQKPNKQFGNTWSQNTQTLLSSLKTLEPKRAVDTLVHYIKNNWKYTNNPELFEEFASSNQKVDKYMVMDCDIAWKLLIAYLGEVWIQWQLIWCFSENGDWLLTSDEGHAYVRVLMPDGTVLFVDPTPTNWHDQKEKSAFEKTIQASETERQSIFEDSEKNELIKQWYDVEAVLKWEKTIVKSALQAKKTIDEIKKKYEKLTTQYQKKQFLEYLLQDIENSDINISQTFIYFYCDIEYTKFFWYRKFDKKITHFATSITYYPTNEVYNLEEICSYYQYVYEDVQLMRSRFWGKELYWRFNKNPEYPISYVLLANSVNKNKEISTSLLKEHENSPILSTPKICEGESIDTNSDVKKIKNSSLYRLFHWTWTKLDHKKFIDFCKWSDFEEMIATNAYGNLVLFILENDEQNQQWVIDEEVQFIYNISNKSWIRYSLQNNSWMRTLIEDNSKSSGEISVDGDMLVNDNPLYDKYKNEYIEFLSQKNIHISKEDIQIYIQWNHMFFVWDWVWENIVQEYKNIYPIQYMKTSTIYYKDIKNNWKIKILPDFLYSRRVVENSSLWDLPIFYKNKTRFINKNGILYEDTMSEDLEISMHLEKSTNILLSKKIEDLTFNDTQNILYAIVENISLNRLPVKVNQNQFSTHKEIDFETYQLWKKTYEIFLQSNTIQKEEMFHLLIRWADYRFLYQNITPSNIKDLLHPDSRSRQLNYLLAEDSWTKKYLYLTQQWSPITSREQIESVTQKQLETITDSQVTSFRVSVVKKAMKKYFSQFDTDEKDR